MPKPLADRPFTRQVQRLFHELNKRGIVAKRRYSCCGGCIWAEAHEVFPVGTKFVATTTQMEDAIPDMIKDTNHYPRFYLSVGITGQYKSDEDDKFAEEVKSIARELGFAVNKGLGVSIGPVGTIFLEPWEEPPYIEKFRKEQEFHMSLYADKTLTSDDRVAKLTEYIMNNPR